MEKKPKLVIGGYTVFDRKKAGAVMIVVGHHPTAPAPYATWKAYDFTDFTSFNHGHYFQTKEAAMVDFYQRLAEAWENYTPARTQPHGKDRKPHDRDDMER